MTYRIELLFVGEAPEDEMARARVLAAPDVQTALHAFAHALTETGFKHEVKTRTVRSTPKAPRQQLRAAE